MTSRYGEAGTVGKGIKVQSVAPRLARRSALVGTGARRTVTGAVGKGILTDLTAGLKGAKAATGAGLNAFKVGANAGMGRSTALASPALKAPRVAQALGTQAGSAGSAMAANPGKTALGVGATTGLGLLAKPKQQPSNGLAKRSYDPEDNRRHRQGEATATATIGGAAGLGYSGNQIYRDTRRLRRVKPIPNRPHLQEPDHVLRDPKTSEIRGGVAGTAHETLSRENWAREKTLRGHERVYNSAVRKIPKGHLVSSRAAAAGAGGLALLGLAGNLHNRRNDSRWT